MWEPTKEVPLEKIKFLKEWCEKNNCVTPTRKTIHPGNPKTYDNRTKKTEVNLGNLVNRLRTQYRAMRFTNIADSEKNINSNKEQKRDLTKEEINAVNAISNWYWESWEGYARVYKKCIEKEIKITTSTIIDFDVKEVCRIGSWVSKMRSRAIAGTLEINEIILIESLPNWSYEPDHDAFMLGIKEFSMYVSSQGNGFDIPQKTVTKNGFKLGQWVSKTRQKYKNSGRLSSKSNYSIFYKKLLDDCGFLWIGIDLRGGNVKEKIDLNRIKNLKKQGLSIPAIAKKIGVHRSTINRYLKNENT